MQLSELVDCDFHALALSYNEGITERGEINLEVAGSLQTCNGTELSNFYLYGNNITLYDHNYGPACNITSSLNLTNGLQDSAFAEEIKSIIINASAIAERRLVLIENEKPNQCSLLTYDIYKDIRWFRYHISEFYTLYLYNGVTYNNCLNLPVNATADHNLLSEARHAAYETILSRVCWDQSTPSSPTYTTTQPNSTSSTSNETINDLIVGGVITFAVALSISAAYFVHKGSKCCTGRGTYGMA